jgi:RimJ/RimL family protein N-acetyltransferase
MTIETPRLRLRPLKPGDLSALVAYRALEQVSRWQTWSDYSPATGQQLIEDSLRYPPFTPGQWFQLGVETQPAVQLIGDLYVHLDDRGDQAQLGYTFDPQYWGRGLALEAVQALLYQAFSAHGLHRVQATTDPRNLPSIRLLQRLGFRQEAHFRQSMWFKGAWADDLVFGLLASEWNQ